jgi:NRPS condensation-like uncharacterized protein
MTKNPIINALAAIAYIGIVSSIMLFGEKIGGPKASIFAPIAFLSLFTLSAATMAYIFGYQPFVMYFDNKKKQAIKLFLQTIAVFGSITMLLLLLLLTGTIS